jgi:hypothetical protein
LFFCWQVFLFPAEWPAVATLPSALFNERFSLGANWVFSFQPVLPPVCRPFLYLSMKVGQAIYAVTGTRALGFCFSFLEDFDLCRERHRLLVAVAQRFVSFSTHPQAMQQHR